MACLITAGQLIDCTNLPKGGVKKYVLLYNFTDWATIKASGNITFGANGEITALTNTSGVAAFKFEVPDETALTLASPLRAVEGGFDGYNHSLNFSVVATTQEAKNTVSKMRFENMVAIVMKNDETGEVYGNEQGMKLVTNGYSPTDPNLGGVIPIELITADSTPAETQLPATIDAGTPATTKTLIDALIVPGI